MTVMKKLNKTELKVLSNVVEFTVDGYALKAFGMSDRDYKALKSLETMGLVGYRMGRGYFALPSNY